MIEKNIIILGNSTLAKEIGKQFIDSKKIKFLGFIKENGKDVLKECAKYDLGDDISILKTLSPDLCIALDYHKIIPAEIISKFAIINSHGGILPEVRGYHALGWEFINGKKKLGYSLHVMDEELDNGPVLYTFEYPIGKNTTFGDLKSAIYTDQKKILYKLSLKFLNGKIKPKQKNAKYPKYYAKRNLADCYIDWNQKSECVDRFIRGLMPPSGPGAFTVYDGKKLVILSTELYPCKNYSEVPGHVVYKTTEKILVKTKDKCIWVKEVQYENKTHTAGSLIKKTGVRLGINLLDESLKERRII